MSRCQGWEIYGPSPDIVRIDIDKGRRLPADSNWPYRAEAERVERMSAYRVAYMLGNFWTKSIIRRLGELCEGTR